MLIPEMIEDYTVYGDDEQLIGVTEEMELPSFEPTTSTVAGAGIMGEMEVANDGHFGSQEIVIPFRTTTKHAYMLMEPGFHTLTLRASKKSSDSAEGKIYHHRLKIVIRGRNKKMEPGKLKMGEGMETKLTMELFYIKIEEAGSTLLEVSKTDRIYVVNGKDYYADIRKNL